MATPQPKGHSAPITNRILQHRADRAAADRFIDMVLLAVGRSLLVAQEFERHARFVTWAAHAAARVTSAQGDGVDDLWSVLNNTRYPDLIGPALGTLKALGVFDTAYLDLLRQAKDARNAIAHEAALLPLENVAMLAEHATKLIDWVDAIDAADIRLAKYTHDIEEPHDGVPLRIFEEIAAERRAVLVAGLAPLLQRVPPAPE